MDGMFSSYYVLKKLSDYLKAYNKISPDPEVKQSLMLLQIFHHTIQLV